MPQVGVLDTVLSTTHPGLSADWNVTTRNGRLSFTNVSNGRGLTVTAAGRLGSRASSRRAGRSSRPRGARLFPKSRSTPPARRSRARARPLRSAASSTPTPTSARSSFLGGRFHCGRPWSPYGVTVALKDCADHQPNGAGAVAENFFTTGTPVGTHDTDGWPTFAGWPRADSLTHEGTYWNWIERAWRGGLRHHGERPGREPGAVRDLSAEAERAATRWTASASQARGHVRPPGLHRRPVQGAGQGLLPHRDRRRPRPGGSSTTASSPSYSASRSPRCSTAAAPGDTPHCTRRRSTRARRAARARRAFAVPGAQVRQRPRRHGVRRRRHRPARQRRQQVRHRRVVGSQPCAPGAEADNSPTNLSGNQDVLYAVFGQARGARCSPATCPPIPPVPLCNPRASPRSGPHRRGLADRGMIVETDHMSVKARQQTLDVLEARATPGSSPATAGATAPRSSGSRTSAAWWRPTPRPHPTYVDAWQCGPRQPCRRALRHRLRLRHQRPGRPGRSPPRCTPRTRSPTPTRPSTAARSWTSQRSGTRL